MCQYDVRYVRYTLVLRPLRTSNIALITQKDVVPDIAALEYIYTTATTTATTIYTLLLLLLLLYIHYRSGSNHPIRQSSYHTYHTYHPIILSSYHTYHPIILSLIILSSYHLSSYHPIDISSYISSNQSAIVRRQPPPGIYTLLLLLLLLLPPLQGPIRQSSYNRKDIRVLEFVVNLLQVILIAHTHTRTTTAPTTLRVL
jgi:hypothetical protein